MVSPRDDLRDLVGWCGGGEETFCWCGDVFGVADGQLA